MYRRWGGTALRTDRGQERFRWPHSPYPKHGPALDVGRSTELSSSVTPRVLHPVVNLHAGVIADFVPPKKCPPGHNPLADSVRGDTIR